MEAARQAAARANTIRKRTLRKTLMSMIASHARPDTRPHRTTRTSPPSHCPPTYPSHFEPQGSRPLMDHFCRKNESSLRYHSWATKEPLVCKPLTSNGPLMGHCKTSIAPGTNSKTCIINACLLAALLARAWISRPLRYRACSACIWPSCSCHGAQGRGCASGSPPDPGGKECSSRKA